MSNFDVVSLITEGESSVLKRYFEGLENDGQCFSKIGMKLRSLENDGPLFASHTSRKKYLFTRQDSQTWYGVCWACRFTASSWYRRRTVLQDIRIIIATDGAHSHHLQQLAAYVKRQWLDRRSVGPNRLCVSDNRARVNNIIESYHSGLRRTVGEFKFATWTCSTS